MKTEHRIYYQSAARMTPLAAQSIDLVVTSPPYPMIQMWDDILSSQQPEAGIALEKGDGPLAFERMHRVLDTVWKEVFRVVRPGGFACINIGDAVRKVGDNFGLYANHARIITTMQHLGFTPLPAVIWRKQTNAPNKYMGSGMLPAGAYVTLEHEYLLIFRKGGKREFDTAEDRLHRQRSAIFWEERNQWFSDIWLDLKGARQKMVDEGVRKRSGSFPFELPYRLINMYSVKGDTVLDPFAGLGTTMAAAMACGRNSAGFEIAADFAPVIRQRADDIVAFANQIISSRIERHLDFAAEREKTKGPMKYVNSNYGFPVMTRQERELLIDPLESVCENEDGTFSVTYSPIPEPIPAAPSKEQPPDPGRRKQVQRMLF